MAALIVLLAISHPPAVDAATRRGPGPGEVTVLDTVTGATCTYTNATPRTYLGLPIRVADPGVPLAITSMEAHFVSVTGQSYDDVRIRVQFWERLNGGLSPAFLSQAGETQEVSIGARQFITRNAYAETIQFAHPITFVETSDHAFAINIQGLQNGVYADSDALTPCLRLGTPFAVGSVALAPIDYGYYRNRNAETDFNFSQSVSTMGSYSAIMVKLYAQSSAPTPTPTATHTPELPNRAHVPFVTR